MASSTKSGDARAEDMGGSGGYLFIYQAAIYKTLCDILNGEKLSGTFLTVEL